MELEITQVFWEVSVIISWYLLSIASSISIKYFLLSKNLYLWQQVASTDVPVEDIDKLTLPYKVWHVKDFQF